MAGHIFRYFLRHWAFIPAFWPGNPLLYAQNPYRFVTYNRSDGLSDNRVTCIYKDRTGYMWIGTENGLNRFDGSRFTVYAPGNGDLAHAHINSIQQDQAGRYWVATQNGLHRIDPAVDTTLVFLPGNKEEKKKNPIRGIPSNLVWDVYIDREDRVWMAPDNRDLCVYDIRNDRLTAFPWQNYLVKQFPARQGKYNSVRKIYRKSDHEIWLGTSAGLFSMHTQTGAFTCYNSLFSDHFIQLYWDEHSGSAFFVQNPGDYLQMLKTRPLEKTNTAFAAIPLLEKNEAAGKKIWLPMGNQLAQINTANGYATRIVHETDNAASLPQGDIRVVYQDNTEVVWVGSDAGLSKFSSRKSLFPYIPVFQHKRQKPLREKDIFRSDHLLHTVLYDAERQRYYLSSPENGQLILLNAKTREQQVFSSIQGVPLKNCSVLHKDKQGRIWIFANRQAFLYDPVSGKFSGTAFKCKGTMVTDVVQDTSGVFWIASYNDGVYRFDPAQKSIAKLREDKRHSSDLPTSLYYDPASETLWVGTFNTGLCAYNTKTRKFTYYIQSDKAGEIGASFITDIVKGKNGRLWISSYAGGLIVYDAKESRKFRHLTTGQGLPDNKVYSLAASADGKIWGTTYNGLFSMDENTEAITAYGSDHGLAFTDFHSPFTRAGNGDILTPVDKGFLQFNSPEVLLRSDAFNVVINHITIPGKEIYTATGPAPEVRMAYAGNEITIDFAALSYAAPHLIRYHYKMEGLDEKWQSGGQTRVRYTHIPPGRYTFKIKAVDHTGRWSLNEPQLPLIITPPWWQTGWFWTAAVLIVSGTLTYIARRRIQQIRHKAHLRMEIRELKEKALRAQMNPHFIFNSLNAIQELIVIENYEASYRYLSKFSRLLRIVLHASEKDLIPLEDELEIISLYLKLESLRFKNSFSYRIDLDPDVDKDLSLFPPMLLQPFVENAIWHGLRSKKGPKELVISFRLQENYIKCTITDNGIGREEALKARAGRIDKAHVQSRGIELARQRLASLKATAGIDGSIVIIDLENGEKKACGTSVVILIENTSL